MMRFFSKLRFIHGRLWRRDGVYRAATLFGPPPLIGAMLAGAVWVGVMAFRPAPSESLRWAAPQRAAFWNTTSATPEVVRPGMKLPAAGADGRLAGYEPGWQATTHPIEFVPPMDLDVKATSLAAMTVNGMSVAMADIVAAGPKGTWYVGSGIGLLAIRTPGIYSLAARFERPASQPADCLVRLALGPRRITSNVDMNLQNDISKDFDAARFDLQPGLYPVGWAFGCWHGRDVVGPGRMTLLIGRPGEPSLRPAHHDDVVRPMRSGP